MAKHNYVSNIRQCLQVNECMQRFIKLKRTETDSLPFINPTDLRNTKKHLRPSYIIFSHLSVFAGRTHVRFLFIMTETLDGCDSNPNICKYYKDIERLGKENAALRDDYAVNYTVSLTEYQRLREALYRSISTKHKDGLRSLTTVLSHLNSSFRRNTII